MPDDLGDELDNIQRNVLIRGLVEHPGDTIRVQHATVPIGFFTKWCGFVMGRTKNGQFEVIARFVPTGGVGIAQRGMSTRL